VLASQGFAAGFTHCRQVLPETNAIEPPRASPCDMHAHRSGPSGALGTARRGAPCRLADALFVWRDSAEQQWLAPPNPVASTRKANSPASATKRHKTNSSASELPSGRRETGTIAKAPPPTRGRRALTPEVVASSARATLLPSAFAQATASPDPRARSSQVISVKRGAGDEWSATEAGTS
jgi:hypothetical protein